MYIRSFSIDWSGEIGRSYVADIEAIRVWIPLLSRKILLFLPEKTIWKIDAAGGAGDCLRAESRRRDCQL